MLEIRGNKLRLGVDAPQDVPVQREELEAKIGQDYPVRWNVLPFSRAMADDNAPQNPRSLSRQVHRKPIDNGVKGILRRANLRLKQA